MANLDTLAAEYHDAAYRLGTAIRDELKTRLIERGVSHVTHCFAYIEYGGAFDWYIEGEGEGMDVAALWNAFAEAREFIEPKMDSEGEYLTPQGLTREDLVAAFAAVEGDYDDFYRDAQQPLKLTYSVSIW